MLSVEVVSPERVVHTTEGVEVILPTLNGVIGVRTGHLPLIAPLKAGVIVVKKKDGKEELLAVVGGFVEVLPTHVRILADSADLAEELDEVKVKEAMAQAEQAKLEAKDKQELNVASAQIAASLARLKVIARKRGRSHEYRDVK